MLQPTTLTGLQRPTAAPAVARALAEARADAAVYGFDREFVLRHVGGKAVERAGLDPAGLLGRALPDVLPAPAWAQLGPRYRRALKGRTETFMYTLQDGGTHYWVQSRPVHDAAGQIEGGLAVARELSPPGKEEHGGLPPFFAELHEAVTAAPSPAMLLTITGECVHANEPCAELLGRAVDEIPGLTIDDLVHPAEHDVAHAGVLRLMLEAPRLTGQELRGLRANGDVAVVAINAVLLHDADGRPHRLYAQMLDLSARRRDQERLQRRLRQQSTVAALGSRSAVGEVPLEQLVAEAAEAMAATLGVHSGAVVQIQGDDFVVRADTSGITAGQTFPLAGSLLGRVLERGEPVVIDDVRADGAAVPPALATLGARSVACVRIGRVEDPWGGLAVFSREPSAFGDDDVHFLRAVGNLVWDAARREQILADALHRAVHDPVTGLPNRALLDDRLRQALTAARRTGEQVAVLFVDLDDFKVVNDSLGHHVGDVILRAVAQRLAGAIRASDTVARFGGDEFVVVATGVCDEGDATRVADQVLASLEAPVEFEGVRHHVRASIGLRIADPERDTDADALLRDADTAMYRAKERGRGRYEVLDPATRERAVARLRVEQDLRRGLDAGELRLAYQPFVRLADGAVVGAEALVRWAHPSQGLLRPAAFLDVAERSGLSVALGDRVLHEACRQAAAWAATGRALPVTVNVSGRQLAREGAADAVARVLDASGLAPGLLGIELTEQALVEDPEQIGRALTALKGLGVEILLDDFGTGPSSLAHLKRFPIDAVKIDRAFVAGLCSGEGDDAAIVAAVAGMGAAMGRRVIPEGVEHPAQAARLRELGLEVAQGHLFAHAELAPAFDAWLRARAPRP